MIQDAPEKVAAIVRDAGGRVVGRTRLQKISFVLEAAGLGSGFSFNYHHYGPFSDDLAAATRDAVLLENISEDEQPTSWGGFFSTYVTPDRKGEAEGPRAELARLGAKANAVVLELAATALYLAKDGIPDPWEETARRKPDKSADGRLIKAKELYASIKAIKTPNDLPAI